MSNLFHVANSLECPEVKFHSNRDAHDPREATDYLWMMLDDFGYQHCIHRCIGCLEQMDKADKKHSREKPLDNYETAFKVLHDALEQLPENLYAHLLDITNGDCPGCAIQTALMQFPIIARYSENAPIGWDALPCYFEEDIDDWGTRSFVKICHIKALINLNINKLPSRMPPAEKRDVREKMTPGKNVVEFIRSFLDERIPRHAIMTDNDLWTLLKWRPTEESIEFSGTPSRQWKSWAKRELASAKESGSPLFLSRILRVVSNCYEHSTHSYVAGYDDFDGLEVNALSILYQECEYLSNVGDARNKSHGYFPFNVALENADGNLLTGHRDNEKTHYKLTFIGEKECQKHGGIPPPFFQHEIENEHESRSQDAPPPVIVTSTDVVDTDVTANSNAQSAAKSNATATGIGMGGTGGNGGNVAVTFEREAVKVENTTNIPDHANMVEKTGELYDRAFARGLEFGRTQGTPVVPEPTPMSGKNNSQPNSGGTVGGTENADRLSGYYPPSELAVRYCKTPSNVKKKLERLRKSNLSGWVQVTDRGPNDPEFLFQEDAVRSLLEND